MAEQDKILQYSDSGVNYDLMDPFKIACQKAAITTAKNLERFSRSYGLYIHEITESRGESAYEVEIHSGLPTRLRIAHVEEGLGTKNEIAFQVRNLQVKIETAEEVSRQLGQSFYRGIGIDNAAMILNDLATRGASPVSFLLHVAAYPSDWFSDEQRNADLIAGTVEACNQARCSWGGGESAALRDIINPGHAVLSGSAWGLIFPTFGTLSASRIEEGDRILLFGSSGPHSNGITLLRTSAMERLYYGYNTLISGDQTYGEAVLAPTIIYSRLMDEVIEKTTYPHYAVHISGHGWRKLMRAQREFTYVIDKIPEPPPVFKLIQDVTGMTNEQIYGDYNMGAGFAIFVEPQSVSNIMKIANSLGYKALDAGYVEVGPRRVVIKPVGVEFKGDTLQIR